MGKTRNPDTNDAPALPKRRRGRPRQSEAELATGTREAILRAAMRVFSRDGYEGGSLEKISTAAKSLDRMVYYYFGSKEGLFIAVLEDMYRRMSEAEQKLKIDLSDPLGALQTIIHFVFDYYKSHPEFIILLNTENLHEGRHLAKMPRQQEKAAREYASPTMERVGLVVTEGQKRGLFRPDILPRNVYLMILATGYFHVSNRYTLSRFLGEALDSRESHEEWKAFMADAVLRAIRA